MKRKIGMFMLLVGLIACRKQETVELSGTTWKTERIPKTTIEFGLDSVLFTTVSHGIIFTKIGTYSTIGNWVKIEFNKIPIRDLCGELDGDLLLIDSDVYSKD